MIMKQNENCYLKKMHPFQKKMGVLMRHISEGSCHLCVTLFVYEVRVYLFTYIHRYLLYMVNLYYKKNVTISQMSQTNVY